MTEFRLEFAAAYDVRDAPSQPMGESVFDFAAPNVATLAPAVEVAVTLHSGTEWFGRFFGDWGGLNVVVNGPAPDELFVVAGGVGYLVPVESPTTFRAIDFEFIRHVGVSSGLRSVFLVGETAVIALDKNGIIAWEARDLVSDGFTSVTLTAGSLVVRGFLAPEDRAVSVTLNLASGEVVTRD